MLFSCWGVGIALNYLSRGVLAGSADPIPPGLQSE
jgi:hypothetical protein